MKAAVVLSFVATALACAGDNCARQVTGTRAGLLDVSSRKADCTSFMKATVTPDATTTTVTVTVDPDEPAKFKRDGSLNYRAATVKPTDVPAYASGCDSASRYSSACSCWGITATTSTAPQPTSTVTVTVTADYCEDL